MTTDASAAAFPTLEDWQHWTLVMGRAQQMLLESWADSWKAGEPAPGLKLPPAPDPMAMLSAGAEAWGKGLEAWGQMLGGMSAAADREDKRFAAPEWRDNPVF